MGILGHYQRPVLFIVLCIILQIFKLHIHGTPYVGMSFRSIGKLFSTLILNRPCSIPAFYPFISFEEIMPVTCFISHRPDYYRGMILIPFDHPLHPFEVCRFPFRLVCQGNIFIITDSMRFHVGFINKIKAIFIAHFIPQLLMGIV